MKLPILGIALILAVSLSPAKAQNIVSNPGFEDGNFTDWTTQNAPSGTYNTVTKDKPNSGSFAAEFGATDNELDYLYQSLSTVVGKTYNVSYFLSIASANQAPANEFITNIGGTVESTPNGVTAGGAENFISGGTTVLDIVDASDSSYTRYTASFTATSDETNLIFGGLDNPLFIYLDDISVTQRFSLNVLPVTPEPSQDGLLLLAAVALIAGKRFFARSLR